MDASPLVSIIVPSFNVEAYVKKCLDSIKHQTYDNWECIIVDRPSTKDNTTKIIKNYIKGDNRFKYIEQVNKGVSDGRNVGFEEAKGRYVQFTDPDDWLSLDMLSHAVERAESTNADIVQFAWSNFYVQTGQYVDAAFIPHARKFPRLFSVNDHGREIFKYGEIHINSMSKLWRRDFLVSNNMHFPTELKRAEDLVEVSRLIMLASKITYLDEILYFYKVDEFLADSLSNFVSTDEHNLDFYKAIKMVHKNMQDLRLLPEHKDGFCRIAIANSKHALYMSQFNLTANKEIFETFREHILPLISNELKSIDPESYDLLRNEDYTHYLQKQMKAAYFDMQEKYRHILALDNETDELKSELSLLRAELDTHYSVKRSVKLVAGNIKRLISQKLKKL